MVSISLDQDLARALIRLREDGVRLAFVYVLGSSFATEIAGEVLPAAFPARQPSALADFAGRAPPLSTEDRALSAVAVCPRASPV